MLSASVQRMRKPLALFLGLLLGVFAGRTVRVENAQACEPSCAPDRSVILQVTHVAGSAQAKTFWEQGVRDAVVTPHYLLFAVGKGQVELGYQK